MWYPQFNGEFVNFTLTVKAPKNWRTISQGKKVYSEDGDNYHVDTWQEKNPQDDIYIVAANFQEYSQNIGHITAMAYLRNKDDELAARYLDITSQYLNMYEKLLGPYPYSKFAVVENFWETGYGMPSFTLLGPRVIRLPFILYTSYPHELLHNWWGNSVYVDYATGNWSEGLTSYLADHLLKEQRGQGFEYRRTILEDYVNYTQAAADFPLKNFISRYDKTTAAIGYGKTLMLFHMLRQMIGDQQFKQGLKTLYEENKFKKIGFVQIANTFSKVSNTNLNNYFSQWINRAGAPDLKLGSASSKLATKGRYKLTIELQQLQQGDAYQLQIPVVITLLGQNIVQQEIIAMNNKKQTFEFELQAAPLRVDIDPRFDVFRKLSLSEIPPSLAKVFGAEKVLIVLPDKANEDFKQAYKMLAETFRSVQSGSTSIQFDNQLTSLPEDHAIWLLGQENKFRPLLIESIKKYGVKISNSDIQLGKELLSFDHHSVILSSSNPKNKDLGFALIAANESDAIQGLARKLPHYGKYSYLGFEGNAPTNIVKGQWLVSNSALSLQLTDQSVNMAELPVRKPLITMEDRH